MDEPPKLNLPVPDFRSGYTAMAGEPSANLVAVLDQSERRQAWYKEFAEANGLGELGFVGSAADMKPAEAAGEMRRTLSFEVSDRRGSWADTRRTLIRNFEELGGLAIATSMVGNKTRKLLDPNEFRGFSFVDTTAPLVFVNTNQTMNGQIFTLAHELAHVWHGQSGIDSPEISITPDSPTERWCSLTASHFLVPREDLKERMDKLPKQELPLKLDALARAYKCGTLVILQALRDSRLVEFENFGATYAAEEARLDGFVKEGGGGGDFYNSQPLRASERLSRAVLQETSEGRTTLSEALSLMSMKSPATLDEYAKRLGAA
ncbi:ImmA/IrrE family metallo-endopeptidase [Nigerium massiliense]|uniref:ImmA/IrrE family metallo-endopeptidase n=1 Tax=Nigerium massiliense TaxID=1522317 RepID=UPI0012FE031B|nr:ImmA/IrrE family metallo-endopeptidase [Nigerium massiliense]